MTRGYEPLDDELALTRMDADASDDVIAAAGMDGVERAERAGCFPLALGLAGDAARAAAAGIDAERWRAGVYLRHAEEAHWLLRVAVVEASCAPAAWPWA